MTHRKVYFTLVLCTFFWGANFSLGKYLVKSIDPLDVAAWRFLIAGFCMLCYVWLKEPIAWAKLKENIFALSVMTLIGVVGFNLAFFYGLQSTSPINGSLIMTLNPTLTVVLAAIVTGAVITGRQVAGLALSILGVVIVVTNGSWATLIKMTFAQGDWLILFGNLCWACYSIIGRHWIKAISPLQISAATMTMGALVFIVISMGRHGGSLPPIPGTNALLAIMVMALFGTVMAYVWWNNGLHRIGPARTAVFIDLVPIFTMLISSLQGENAHASQWLGSLLVISGVLLSSGAISLPVQKKIAA